MQIADIDPSLQRAFSKMPKLRLDRAWIRWLVRRMPTRRITDPAVACTRHRVPHDETLVYQPRENPAQAGLLWIHGGGMVIGKAAMNDSQCNHYAGDLGLTVVSANYRLAPDHPYPAAIDDCYNTWLWLLAQAEAWGVDPTRIAIGGQSAGGGLAAALCQRIRDQGGPQPAGQFLIYPMLDDRTALRDDLTAIDHILWNNQNNSFGWTAYLGRPAGSVDQTPDWAVPARRRDLSHLPPAWIGVGDKDLFLEEDRAYAQALREAGVACDYYEAELAPHGFDSIVPEADVSRRFQAAGDAFLRRVLALNL